jgi:ubiquinone/menaquinone biosynthesis C-methylase UbiE
MQHVAGHRQHGEHGQGDVLIRWAWLYDFALRLWWRRGERWRNGLIDRLDLRPGQRVLDVGSGTGQLAFVIADRVTPGGSVDGVDAAVEMVSRATRSNRRRRRPVTFRTARAQQLPFMEESFDAVTCTLALHHIAANGRRTAVEEMRRVLRPGGRLLVADFEPGSSGPRWRHLRRFTEHEGALDEAVGLLEATGFVDLNRGSTTAGGIGRVVATKPAVVGP